jgi:hypothetical protein
MNPHRHFALSFFAPFIEAVSRDNTAAPIYERHERRQFRQCFSSRVYHPVADRRVCGPVRNQAPMHEPALVLVPMADNDGNRRGSLLRGNVKAWRISREIAVKVPANPYVTKLERSCDPATHLHSRTIGERWYRGFFGLFLLRFLCDRLRCLWVLDLACTPKK